MKEASDGVLARQERTADRGGHRHGHHHLPGRRQGRQLVEAQRRGIRHPPYCTLPQRGAQDDDRRHGRFHPGRAVLLDRARRAHGDDGGRGSDRGSRHRSPRRLSRPADAGGRTGRDRMAPSRDLGCGFRRQRCRRIRRSPARERLGPLSCHPRALPVRLGGRASRRTFRNQGLADLGFDRLRLGRDRHPARGRGDPARRSRGGAVHRHRRLGQSGSPDPLLVAVGAVHLERSARGCCQAVLQEPRRLRHGGGRRRPRAGEL